MSKISDSEFLKKYDSSSFFKPSVSSDAIVFTIRDIKTDNYRKLPEKKLQVLLVKRGENPFIDKWSIPGVFIQEKENFEGSVKRCLDEKANISDIYLEQLYTWGSPKRDPRTRVISVSHMGLINSDNIDLKPGKNVEDIAWFTINTEILKEEKEEIEDGYKITEEVCLTLENEKTVLKSVLNVIKEYRRNNEIIYTNIISSDLAFDHPKMLIYAIERLKNKVEYTTIAFNLMPKEFTLTKLQQVYEILLDKKLLKANFRRKISEMVIETEHYDENQGHRPSKLFRFNTEYRQQYF